MWLKQISLISLLFCGLGTSPQSSAAKVIEKVHAVVNGEIITLTQIQDYKRRLKSGGFLNDLIFTDPEVRQRASEDEDYLLQLMIQERIMDYEIKRLGLQVTEQRVKKEITTMAQRQNMSVEQMQQAIADQGVDFADYKNFIKKSIERRQLVEKEISSKIKISEQDIANQYLSEFGGKVAQIFEFDLAHILFDQDDEEIAKKVFKQIKSGKKFEELVKEHSQDEGSREENGAFGSFKSGEMIASIEQAIADLDIGETTPVVKTPMGLHIFKVTDKKLIDDPQMQKQKERIYQQLMAREFKEQLDFWLSQKKKDAIIQIN